MGALGIVEQPTMYASKHGPVGFIKGVGKAIVGAVVKPVIGFGDAAVLVMATSKKPLVIPWRGCQRWCQQVNRSLAQV